jgi:hypothetical protein
MELILILLGQAQLQLEPIVVTMLAAAEVEDLILPVRHKLQEDLVAEEKQNQETVVQERV